MCRKLFVIGEFNALRVIRAEQRSGDLFNPMKHFPESKQSRKQYRYGGPFIVRELKMKPNPNVTKNQRDADEQQPGCRISRTSTDSRFVHLSITRFNPKSLPVNLGNLFRSQTHLPDRVQHLFRFPLSGLFTSVSFARDADRHSDVAASTIDRSGQRMFIVSILPLLHRSQSGQAFRRLRLASARERRNDESVPGSLQVSNHIDAKKPFIQEQKLDFHPSASDDADQSLDDLLHRFAVLDARQGQRVAMAMIDNDRRPVSGRQYVAWIHF